MIRRFAFFASVLSVALASSALAAFGCSSAASSASSDGGESTVAASTSCTNDSADAGTLASGPSGGAVFAEVFDCYPTWQSYQLTATADAGPHELGPRTEWINKVPPHGSTEFPVGTIIVKSIPAIGQIFAMEKRGQGYNDSSGATGWEYFDLDPIAADGTSYIVWRGVGPPIGMTYGGDPTTCNDCHVDYKANDFIPSPPLQLQNF